MRKRFILMQVLLITNQVLTTSFVIANDVSQTPTIDEKMYKTSIDSDLKTLSIDQSSDDITGMCGSVNWTLNSEGVLSLGTGTFSDTAGTSTKGIDDYDVSWSQDSGPIIQVAPGTVKAGEYKGVIQWSLTDAPV